MERQIINNVTGDILSTVGAGYIICENTWPGIDRAVPAPDVEHECHRFPVCQMMSEASWCPHASCQEIVNEPPCFACEVMPQYGFCERHGYQDVIDGGASIDFDGGDLYWERLTCGCFA